MPTLVKGTDDFKPSRLKTAPVPVQPSWWPPIDPTTGMGDFRYPYVDPQGTLLSSEQVPQATPYDPTKDWQYRRVPLPGTPTAYEPPSLDKGDPLGLDGTLFRVKASDGKEYVCAFYRKWFYDEVGVAQPESISGTFVLSRFSDPVPSNSQPITWPPVKVADVRAALNGTVFKAHGPNGDQYYGVGMLNATDTTTLNQDVSNVGRIWFNLYRVSDSPLPSSSSAGVPSSSSSSPQQPSSSSSAPSKPSSSSSSSSAAQGFSGFIDPPSVYVKGQTGDIQFAAGADFPVGGNVVFQTWSDVSKKVEAACGQNAPPFKYPADVLAQVTDGDAFIQALVRDAKFTIVKTISASVKFTSQPVPSSSSSHPSSSSSSSSSNPSKVDPLRFAQMYTETKQIQRQVQSAQSQSQVITNRIAAAKTANDAVALMKDLPQLMGTLSSALGTANTESNVLSDMLANIVPQQAGLVGFYFPNTDLTGTPQVRVDGNIDFKWTAPPMTGVPATWSTRWVGKIKSKVSGPVTITANADDGVRVFINDQKVLENWSSHAPMDTSGTVNMAAGATYDIVVEYNNTGGPGSLTLSWSANGLSKETIAAGNLSTK